MEKSDVYFAAGRAHDRWQADLRTRERQRSEEGFPHCPYSEDSREYEDWMDGWGDAADAMMWGRHGR